MMHDGLQFCKNEGSQNLFIAPDKHQILRQYIGISRCFPLSAHTNDKQWSCKGVILYPCLNRSIEWVQWHPSLHFDHLFLSNADGKIQQGKMVHQLRSQPQLQLRDRISH